jgi:hypothetical protein
MNGLEYGPALAIRLSDWLTLFFALHLASPLRMPPLLRIPPDTRIVSLSYVEINNVISEDKVI